VRKLKQGRGRVGLTGKGAGRDEVGFGWRKLDLGGVGNSRARVNDYGWEWVLRLRYDLAQLPEGSIYRRLRWWPVNLGRTRGGRK
jgi:hypothetical protein